jgi:hypothetical protein
VWKRCGKREAGVSPNMRGKNDKRESIMKATGDGKVYSVTLKADKVVSVMTAPYI